MGKIRFIVKTSFGEVSVEGDSPNDVKLSLMSLGVSEDNINRILESVKLQLQAPVAPSKVSITPSKPEVAGIIEYGTDGVPHITIPTDRLTAKEVIALLLYARSPSSVTLSELTSLVAANWRTVEMPYISSALNHMKALVIKEGSKGSYTYKLSGFGKSWVENEALPRFKAGRP